MKDLPGTNHPCPALKSLSDRVGRLCCFHSLQNKYEKLDSMLERKMIGIKRSASLQYNFRSINSIIMKFPQFREGLKEIRGIFQQFDEDCNGSIDREELRKCLKKLHLDVTEEEIDDLFCACDIDENKGIQLNEFIVLLCLIYFLMDSSASPHDTSDVLSPELQATFNTIIEVFLFLDKNGDGKLHKKDVVKALNEDSPWEKSPAHVTRTRFSTIILHYNKMLIMLSVYP